jgi:hypothetical protein
MDDGKDRSHGEHRDRGGDRQIKEGAIRPIDNPKSPPPLKVEVSPPGPSGDSPSGDAGGGSGEGGSGGEER